MKAVLAQLNYHIGNFSDTITRLALEIKKAEEQGADLIIFSELAISGYPPLDLLEYSWFIEECDRAVHQISTISNHVGILIGAPTVNPEKLGKKLYNSAYFLHEGKVKQVFHKTLLPTYDIFDEYRHFEPNKDFTLLEMKGHKIAVTICEDLWFEQPVDNAFSNSPLYSVNPIKELMKLGPDLVVNLAASPFSWSRQQVKIDIFRNNAKKYGLPVLYVNQVGAQTELIFEGGSLVVNAKGEIVHALELFREDRYLVDLDELQADKLEPEPLKPMQGVELIYHGLIMGVRDYFNKLGFRKAILGLSGGIDSAVTLVIACQALGAENITVLLMPSQYSSDHSVKDAVKLAGTLGVSYKILPIKNTFDAYLDALQPVFGDLPHDIAEENIQSRIRGTFLMAYSNKFGNILLNTSNKSEAAVGYGTLYGDMAGGLSVLGDVYKTDVYKIAHFINSDREIIPMNTILKPPSAELKPNQQDTDSLPDYEILDKILHAYIEQQKPIEEIIREGNDPALTEQVIRKVNTNEYKRYQTPPILRISSKAFGVGRRMPVVAKY
jgi:NAD+ synthase (glutamine-hydrolysing)